MSDIVRVLRIVEYVGDRAWVERTVARSIHGTKHCGGPCFINAATLGAYPEILEQGPISDPNPDGILQSYINTLGADK